ncbi:N-acetylmuramic acid 6-phosphate etherase [Microbacterium laevaniformans]|uniref:N-acetylmuramic acid 6-phosphate etherase n=1 Tax=Microbacterium laevaniformans TaxID=36807 RepID=UPI0019587EF0|nr:N-acetylmuramic acid 6-phosphate etherase [Microbacterium laevaniformans]MBM7753866.1 N-acetylmuramic acid 6-phosphate etherase [Microbacterium laevaniformans]GLJ63208.1 N-acetylmuramic acid 6-phosphate etherase [Microbacterium laevaniformans]
MTAPVSAVTTEQQNPRTRALDAMSVTELLTAMNEEDRRVPVAVAAAIGQIARAVDLAVAALGAGGRLIYLGAGTSGRLGVLDAAECPPTFGTDPGQVRGVLAGGRAAMFEAVENAEDSVEFAVADLQAIELSAADVVVGIAASGRTPYVIGGLDHARAIGAATVALAANPNAEISEHADVAIEIDNGPEVLTGSTRLKAGTSQKLVLNMISTATMVRLGKVYGNLMVDVRPTNEKLVDRAVRIVQAATGCDRSRAESALADADGHAKTAIVAVLCGIGAAAARERLADAHGFVRAAIDDAAPAGAAPTDQR